MVQWSTSLDEQSVQAQGADSTCFIFLAPSLALGFLDNQGTAPSFVRQFFSNVVGGELEVIYKFFPVSH